MQLSTPDAELRVLNPPPQPISDLRVTPLDESGAPIDLDGPVPHTFWRDTTSGRCVSCGADRFARHHVDRLPPFDQDALLNRNPGVLIIPDELTFYDDDLTDPAVDAFVDRMLGRPPEVSADGYTRDLSPTVVHGDPGRPSTWRTFDGSPYTLQPGWPVPNGYTPAEQVTVSYDLADPTDPTD